MKKGFTLLEILLVVGAISILAGIVIIAINPSKQLGDTRNAQRRSDVNTILNAIYQYAVDNNGNLPAAITTSVAPICKVGQACAGGINLPELTNAEKYLVSLPADPSLAASAQNTGYSVVKDANNRVTVSVDNEENGANISATK